MRETGRMGCFCSALGTSNHNQPRGMTAQKLKVVCEAYNLSVGSGEQGSVRGCSGPVGVPPSKSVSLIVDLAT